MEFRFQRISHCKNDSKIEMAGRRSDDDDDDIL